MEEIISGFFQALQLILAFDSQLYQIISLSLQVSGLALLISIVIGIPMGAFLGLKKFPGRRLMIVFIYTGMGFPPVVIGLFVYLMLSHSGPLGVLDWLFTTRAMVVAQVIIAFPLVAGFTMAAVLGVNPKLQLQLESLGATPWQTSLAILKEARMGVIVSIVAGFGSIISEVGAVMMVGGNIEGSTRVLTTAIVLETSKGDFALAMGLGIVLLALSFAANLMMLKLQGKKLVEQ
jgi:tungstate transport system permease protein